MKYLTVLLIALSLAGCAQLSAFKQQGKVVAEQAADDSLKVTIWKLCKAASIGSIERWVDGDQKLADARKVVCGQSEAADVVNADE